MLATPLTALPSSSPSLAQISPSSTPPSIPASLFLPPSLSNRPPPLRRVTAGPALELGDQRQVAAALAEGEAAGTSRSQGNSPVVADFARGEGEVPFAEEWRRSFGAAGAKRRSGKGGDEISLSSLRDELEIRPVEQENRVDDESLLESPPSPPPELLQPPRDRKSGAITTPSALVLEDSKSYDFSLFVSQLDQRAQDVAPEAELDPEAREDGTGIPVPSVDEFGRAEDQSGGMEGFDEETWREAARAGEELELEEGRTFVFPPIASTSSLFPTNAHSTPRHSVDLIDFNSPTKSSIPSPQNPTPTRGNDLSLSLTRERNVEDYSDDEDEQDLTESESSSEEEEEDPDSHPLYTLLSTSALPFLRQTWDAATLILVPPRRSLPSLDLLSQPSPSASSSPTKKGFEFVRGARGVSGEFEGRGAEKDREATRVAREGLERFVALHVFKPSEGGDKWRSVGGDSRTGFVQVRLEPARGLAHVEWVIEERPTSSSTAGSTVPELSIPFPPLEARESSESELSLPHTPPSRTLLPLPQPPATSALHFPSHVPLSHPTSLPRPLQIVSESTIYRRPRLPPSLPPPPSPIKAPKPGFRAPKWLRRGSSAPTLAPPAPPEARAPMLERVRVIAVDGEVVKGLRGMEESETVGKAKVRREGSQKRSVDLGASTVSNGGERRLRRAPSVASTRSTRSGRAVWAVAGSGADVGGSRDFLADLAFLATPPVGLVTLSAVLNSTLETTRVRVREFEASFAYIKGFDTFTVQRIRKGILDKAWGQLAGHLQSSEAGSKLLSEERTTLHQLLENVIMGLLYANLYTTSVLPLFAQENSAINHILFLYRSRNISPADLGVDVCDLGSGTSLQGAITAMSKLTPNGTASASVPLEVVLALRTDFGTEEDVRRTLVEAGTPLGCISVMRLAIEEIVAAVEGVKAGSRVAPDDLIPLLAWVMVRSGVEDLESMLYFAKTFRLSDDLAAELDWSFVTFQAALAFLLSDPLGALLTSPLPANFASSSSVPFPASSPPRRRASELPSFHSRRASLHSPHAPSDPSRTPPNSPRSLRTISTTIKTTAAQRVHARINGLGGVFSSGISPVRERRLSWQAGKVQKRPSLEAELSRSTASAELAPPRPPRPERMTSSEEMPPPTWTTSSIKHQRRQSLGVLPSSTLRLSLDGRPGTRHEASIPEVRPPTGASKAQKEERRRTTSIASASAATELQIRPRIVLPPRPSAKSFHQRPASESSGLKTPPLGRSMSSRQIGPSSSDMGRSGSEGSMAPRPSSDVWSLWGGGASPTASERPPSPALSDAPSSCGEHKHTSSADQSWWDWGRERINSVGPGGLAPVPASDDIGTRRARRHSASSADVLGGRAISFPLETGRESQARLAAILGARGSASSSRPPRPRSIMSFSSASSFDTDNASLSGRSALPPRPRNLSLRRELPTSNLSTRPLAPQLDSSPVIALPASPFEPTLSYPYPRSTASLSPPSTSSAFPRTPSYSLPRATSPRSPLQRRQTGL